MNAKFDTRPPPSSVLERTNLPTLEQSSRLNSSTCLLVVVEGVNDVQFLRRISMMLHDHDRSVPNLTAKEVNGEVVFLPIGGGSVSAWSERLAPIGCPEFHIYDRELPPETALRKEAIQRVKSRDGCVGVLTSMRSLENYLHPDAIQVAGGPSVVFGHDDCVPEKVARRMFETRYTEVPWNTLTRRAHKRLRNLAKRWLNTRAVDCMTPQQLRSSDPGGDVLSWLTMIESLVD